MSKPVGLARGAMVLQTLFAGGTYLYVKAAVGDRNAPGPLTPAQLITLRCAGTLAILAALAAARPGWIRISIRRLPRLLLLGALAVPINVGFFFEGAQRAPASHPALFYALTPIFVLLMEFASGRGKLPPSRAAGLALAFAGAYVVLTRGSLVPTFTGASELTGDFLLLCAAASWGLYTVLSRAVVAELGAMTLMTVSLSLGCLMWLPIGVPLSAPLSAASLPASAWAAVLYLAAITSVVSYALWLYALKRLDASQVAVFMNLQPVVTALLVWAIRGEPIEPSFAAGTALVFAGVMLVQRFGRARESAS